MATPRTGKPRGRPKGAVSAKTKAKRAGHAKALAKVEATAERTKRELAGIAYSSLGDFMAPDGNWKPFHELTREQAACVKSVKVVKRNVEAGDGHVDTVYELVLWDKPKALEMLAKHFGLLLERVEHSGAIEVKWQD